MDWICPILTLPKESATVRMRAWRALKSSGAAVLRDGVHLLPDRLGCRSALESVAADVTTHEGTAYIVRMEQPSGAVFAALFDRGADYAAFEMEAAAALR